MINLQRVEVGGRTTIATGATTDEVNVFGSRFDGSFSLSTGNGNDHISIARHPSGPTRFFGAVSARAGGGDDIVEVGDPAIARFEQTNRWNGGSGIGDQIFFADINEFNGGDPILAGFE
jgi:hypothetical protein